MVQAVMNEARALFQAGGRADAIALLAGALEENEAPALAHAQLGEFLLAEGRRPDALARFSKALERDARDYVSLLNLGILSLDAGRLEHGLKFFREALQVCPTSPEAWNNLGVAHQRLCAPSQAVQCYVRALALRPGFLDALVNLSFAHHQCGDYEEALTLADKALALSSSNPVAHWHRALALLSLGHFREGFQSYEWRLSHPQFQKIYAHLTDIPKPMWDGKTHLGKTLLVHAEQGIGDTVQFCRFLPIVAAQGMKVVFECPPDLLRFVNQMPGVRVVPRGQTVEHFDFHCPLLSLLQHMGFDRENVPSLIPLLRVRPEWRREAALAPSGKLRVGLCWSGNRSHSDDAHRSTTLSMLHALAGIDGVEFVNLQREATRAELEAFPGGMVYVEPLLSDVASRAALVAQMHLVVTVDTSVAHLAGVLGVPCWLMLGKACDWRWGSDPDATPWYPSMRLFRQDTHGDWAGVVERMRQTLIATLPAVVTVPTAA